MFVYGAVYADRADADADYDTLLDLHSADLVGSYDVALVYKDDDGKVHVTKHEKPTQHGAWKGAAVGALVGIVFPPAILGSALVGAAAGGGIGHAMGGMSRSDAKELGDYLNSGQAALVVIGKSRVRSSSTRRSRTPRRPKRRKSTPTARSSRRNSTRCLPSSVSSWPARSRTALGLAARERHGSLATRHESTVFLRPSNGPSRQGLAAGACGRTDTSSGSARDRDERRDDARRAQPDAAGRAASPQQR